MYKQFTTSVIVFKNAAVNTQVLLIHHKKFDRWMIPGGHVEILENPNEAAIREVFEETGVTIKLVSFIHKEVLVTDGKWLLPPEYLYEQIIPASSKEQQHFHIDFTYIGIALKTELTLNTSETNGVRWVDISELKYLNLFDGTRQTINDAYHKLLINEAIKYEVE